MDNFGPLIKKANTLIEKELNNQMRKIFTETNLTGPQVALLVFLFEANGKMISQKELETTFAISHPTIRGIIKRLVQQDLINTAVPQNDKRQVVLSLTDRGVSLMNENIEQIQLTMEQVNHKIISNISKGSQEELSVNLKQIIQNFS
ncbi:MarR family winged helix-turn-helix transcriptional regulator [Xylocopilactobacillus apicola]|uniref:HTH-type transcriptional regulator MgrA n=1 Tax=Xylocopilactobacillus apicola TaxID=2932184 RepID=A0AAU9DAY4_9LACO|nr:MarR family transcriptional regulator [Xylocopilactobacillus apicola]BDR58720.1 hypothetical protein XA3_11610 [Xylocopilactobacillus apicola]